MRAKLQKRRQELTQTTPDQPVDDEVVYYKVAGDFPKGYVCSLMLLWRKKRRYVDPDASTSQVLAQRMDNFMILRGRGNPEDEDVEDINRHPEETSTTGRGSLTHHATPAHPDDRYSLHYTHGWSHVTVVITLYLLIASRSSISISTWHSISSSLMHSHLSMVSSARSSSSKLRSSIPYSIEEIPDFFIPPTAHAEGENPLIYLIAKHGLYITLHKIYASNL
ncbi:hypothetical protein Syun_030071 [Stephania yunnanensis]|uniref:Uncharacterized protein n=1 Tax=Stephania yunnanensis TaxID=152371 RepID=A0AAP0EBB6_9MAGN